MKRQATLFILIFFVVTGFVFSAMGGQRPRQHLIRDGFGLSGVAGRLVSGGPAEPDRWRFELAADVNDDVGIVKAGTAIEMLPSSALEKMLTDAKAHSSSDYRLWGTVTKYRGKNFIYPIYFLASSKVEEVQTGPPTQDVEQPTPAIRKEEGVAVNEPNDALAIPEEITKRLAARPVITQQRSSGGQTKKQSQQEPQPQLPFELEQDFILVDRTGFIVESKDESRFVLDALGRNIADESFELLACEALERVEVRQSGGLEKMRFKVSGIVTCFRGRNYLLLQRAIRSYSYGNFGN